MHINCFNPIDEQGKPVKKTKEKYPYSYDGFVQERCGENSEANATIYTDRLNQQDPVLTSKLLKKYFVDSGIDDGGDWWNERPAHVIQDFLRERLNNPNLRVILVMEYCNLSNGYPVWRIDYHS